MHSAIHWIIKSNIDYGRDAEWRDIWHAPAFLELWGLELEGHSPVVSFPPFPSAGCTLRAPGEEGIERATRILSFRSTLAGGWCVKVSSSSWHITLVGHVHVCQSKLRALLEVALAIQSKWRQISAFLKNVLSHFLSLLAPPLDVIGTTAFFFSFFFSSGSSRMKLGFFEHTQCSKSGRSEAKENIRTLVPLQPETNVLTLLHAG